VTATIAPSTARELATFAFRSADNPGLAADVAATIDGSAIAATLPFGSDVSRLVATFTTTGVSVKVGGAAQTSGASANDFSQPVPYTVAAADGSVRTYTVTVRVAPSPAKELASFKFLSVHNPDLGADVVSTIDGTAIAATVPFGTPVFALRATFATTGTSVKIAGVAQVSGVTVNDFRLPITYTVTAADGSTRDYTVRVTVAGSPAKEITSFGFLTENNPGLASGVFATIGGTAISVTLPFGSDRRALVATYATTGDRVAVGNVPQVSGHTANDFTRPVVYTVTAADGSVQAFTVTVAVALNPAKELTALSFRSVNNPTVGHDVVATIHRTAITAALPFGSDVTALKATFSTTGASVRVGGTPQTSGQTATDFTSPVTFTVVAADGSTQDYTVTVTVAERDAKAITAFGFATANNPGLPVDVRAAVTGDAIVANVPFGFDVTALTATFEITGARVTVGGVVQVSGQVAHDFTAPVIYTVVAADGSTEDFTVTVVAKRLLVANAGGGADAIEIFSAGATGNVAPLRSIGGPETTLVSPTAAIVEGDEIIVCDKAAEAITVFPVTASGNVAPTRRLVGPATRLRLPTAVVAFQGELFVSQQDGTLFVYPLTGSGDVAPIRSYRGLASPAFMAIDQRQLYVSDGGGSQLGAGGPQVLVCRIPGDNPEFCGSKIDRPFIPRFDTPFGLAIGGGEFFVSMFSSSAEVLVFPVTAGFNPPLVRTLLPQGGALAIAYFNDELYSSSYESSIVVTPAHADGAATPARVLQGPATRLHSPYGVFVF
jgi:hypothetical protein